MVERHPHSINDSIRNLDPGANPDPYPEPSHHVAQLAFTPGTYVVQVPKDQIYRLPPSENAHIADQSRNAAANNIKRRTFCSSLTCGIVLFFVLVIIGLSLGIAFLSFKPANPIFQVKQLLMDNIDKATSRPILRVTVNIVNRNGNTGFLYKKVGSVAIFYMNQENCAGSFPGFHQDGGDSRCVDIVLNACDRDLPADIKDCMKRKKPKKNVYLDVRIDLSVIARKGILVRHLKMVVVCRLVVDTLCKGSGIISQSCKTR